MIISLTRLGLPVRPSGVYTVRIEASGYWRRVRILLRIPVLFGKCVHSLMAWTDQFVSLVPSGRVFVTKLDGGGGGVFVTKLTCLRWWWCWWDGFVKDK